MPVKKETKPKTRAKSFLMISGGILMTILALFAVVGVVMLVMGESRHYSRNNTINVQGTGEVFVEPDVADISFTVREVQPELKEAQAVVSEKVAAILAAIEGAGIDAKDVKTHNYSSGPQHEWQYPDECANDADCHGKSVVVGYYLNQSVRITVRDLDMIPDVLVALGDAGVEHMQGPNFRVDDADEARIEARNIAIEKARLEAAELADSLDVRLKKMTKFNESGVPFNQNLARGTSSGMAMVAAEAPELPAGQNMVSVTVNMTYKIK